jgi:hypothetical protein
MKLLLLLVGWFTLLALSWPLALVALFVLPLVWLIALPLLLAGVVMAALLAFLKALLFLPARVLGHRG